VIKKYDNCYQYLYEISSYCADGLGEEYIQYIWSLDEDSTMCFSDRITEKVQYEGRTEMCKFIIKARFENVFSNSALR
jgi:hypothetical protein